MMCWDLAMAKQPNDQSQSFGQKIYTANHGICVLNIKTIFFVVTIYTQNHFHKYHEDLNEIESFYILSHQRITSKT
ncbi:hypothetical protein RCL_jg15970.t2 [Rhizophagus clarus]|uniref:Uncharacterized protein n=1 Tax=Rhizophagus clarus TaxID=94130 RepID=A0A8H3LAL5_9GLOM|nr:hypothetical protein RCL_jg15970.t2 [Rhizophagus clarus]